MDDQEIAQVLAASDVEPEDLAELVEMAGVQPTGDAVGDIKAMAYHVGVEVESLLYGLFSEDNAMFADEDQWSQASEWDDPNE